MPVAYKSLLLILDGLGDRPVPVLEGRTPLEAARTPNMDRLVADGLCGLVDPLSPGTPVDTQTGTGVLLGLSRKDIGRLSRGPVEAAGVGLTLRPGDVALRCNFATVAPHGAGYEVLDRRAGRISEGTDQLAEAVNAIEETDGVRATLIPAAQHRAVLRLSGPGLSADISDSDPGSAAGAPPLRACHARHAGDPRAVRTAQMLNGYLRRVAQVLEDHPVNLARRERGMPPANGLLTRGAGAPRPLHNLLQHLDVSAAVVAGDRTALGLAALSGFTRITQPGFTCLPDTDLDGKTVAARRALQTHDFVCLHIKATDVVSHDRNPAAKRDFLERVDAALAPLFAEDIVIGIAADHTTNSLTGRHTGDPVPALLRAPGGRRDACVAFGEGDCMRGGLGRVRAADFLRSLLDAAGAIGAYTPADEYLL